MNIEDVKVNRVEIIDRVTGKGRVYVFWEDLPARVSFSFQDGDRTLKLFIEPEDEDNGTVQGVV
jgi:hypothetical protein